MDHNLFDTYIPVLRSFSRQELEEEIASPRKLLIESATSRAGKIEIAYAPFDHVTSTARLAIVGITPGRQQMGNALRELHRLLQAGQTTAEALCQAKRFASFSGPMRSNLVAMLDHVGIHDLLGLSSTSALWNGDGHVVHFTSALRYPVFCGGANYSGTPSMLSVPLLRTHLLRWFGAELLALPDAIIVPLGPKVAEALKFAARELGIADGRILDGLPHPSGANAERIAFFLDRKPRDRLSTKVDPEGVLRGRELIRTKLASLRSWVAQPIVPPGINRSSRPSPGS